MIPPLALDGPCVTIRRFVAERLDRRGVRRAAVGRRRSSRGRWRTAPTSWCRVARRPARPRCATRSRAFVPADDRVVTIEETAELQLPIPHVVRLEARPPNAEGAGGGPGARARARGVADAARPHRGRRGARRRGVRPAAGAQHRSRRLAHHGPCQRCRCGGRSDHRVSCSWPAPGSGVGGAAPARDRRSTSSSTSRDATAARRIETVGEVRRARRQIDVAPLFATVDGALRAVGAPVRPPRRPDAPRPDSAWFAC